MRAPALFLVFAACGSLDHESTVASQLDTEPPYRDQLALWLDGSRGVHLFPNGEVWWWDDQSGHDHLLVRGSPDQPSIVSAKLPDSDQLALLFEPDGSGNRGYLVNSAVAIRAPMTIAMAFRPLPTGDDHYDTPLGGIRIPTVAITKRVEHDSFLHASHDVSVTTGHSSTHDFQYLSVADAWTEANHVVVATLDGDTSRLSVDGSGGLHAPIGSLGYAPLDGIALSHYGDRTFRGYIAEILIYGDALDPFTEAEVVAYLAHRYQ